MTDLIPFQFQSITIRAIQINGDPWFVGKDVAEALGYANTTDALNKHCRGVAKRYPIVDNLGRSQEARIINEPDLYRLTAKSQLPEAEKFEKWVFEEVLPTVRRTGGYGRTTDPMAVLADPAAMRGLLLTYTEKVLELQHTVEEQAPKVAALQRLEDAEGSFGLREAAQVLDMPERKLTRHLDAEGWIYKMPNSRRWQGYADKRKAGLVTHKTRRYQREDGDWCEADYVRITPKGIAKLAQQFAKQRGLFAATEPA
ncbi:BRO family protein [Stenotrophomonas maltophilia]|uniref:BRO family protein n=1 Tax=Stenotrophomonas maltophilia TaxID=40324 RepID=UPI003B5D9E1B